MSHPGCMRRSAGCASVGLVLSLAVAHAGTINVVAAENVYGSIVAQIGGPRVAVSSVLSSPNQDPHEFEARPSTARAIAAAQLVVYNGAGYDPWAMKLLAASPSRSRETVDVAQLAGKTTGDNPHLWYEPKAVAALAAVIAARLSKLDPDHGAEYAHRLSLFAASMDRLRERIAALRGRYAGTAVSATEPVFDYMADALDLKMRNGGFALAVMNGSEPAAAAIVAFENDLRTRAVRVLIYNSQTTQALARRMRSLANQSGVPVVAVTETLPEGVSYPEWMLSQLDALERALDRPWR